MPNKFKSIKIREEDYLRLISRGKFGDTIYGLVSDLLDAAEEKK